MPLSLVAAVGAPDANSYLTLAEFAERAEVAGVLPGQYSTDAITRALLWATKRIDRPAYKGAVASAMQALAHPRTGLPNPTRGGTYPDTEIAEEVLEATALLTCARLQGFGVGLVDDLADFKRLRVEGATDMEFRDTRLVADSLERLPAVWALIAPLLVAVEVAGGAEATAGRPAYATLRSLR